MVFEGWIDTSRAVVTDTPSADALRVGVRVGISDDTRGIDAILVPRDDVDILISVRAGGKEYASGPIDLLGVQLVGDVSIEAFRDALTLMVYAFDQLLPREGDAAA